MFMEKESSGLIPTETPGVYTLPEEDQINYQPSERYQQFWDDLIKARKPFSWEGIKARLRLG